MVARQLKPREVVIIGAGIAGLSAGVYAQLNGYRSRIYEMHTQPGGLMTAWKRKGYTIEGCIHWLTGSNPTSAFYRMWEEIGLIQNLQMFDPELFSVYEGSHGQTLNLYSDVNRLEKHLLTLAPEDEQATRELCSAVRTFTRLDLIPPADFLGAILFAARMAPHMSLFNKWTRMTMKELGQRFKNPFLCEAFSKLWDPEMSAFGLIMTLSMLNRKDAGYPIGGSLPMAHAVEKRYVDLGGEVCYSARVNKILIEGNCAVGVQLADGQEVQADYVISAADGHATIFDMLGGRYINDEIRQAYQHYRLFPSLVFIGLGVNRKFEDLPAITGGISMELDHPMEVAGKPVDRLEFEVRNFDPTLAPGGKTLVTVMIVTDYSYWKELHGDQERYDAEKQRVALEVIARLDRRFPGFAGQVEMADVATPVTFERYTGNWQGSYEGFIPTPQTVTKQLPKTLPGLENFYMVGQWVQPGGGLPSGVMTGRAVVQMLCKKDRKPFKAPV